ncbi:MAG: MFS transporter, partial [Firmicutes bacterium]|nr:MFS transporter [Bacillota bacterium]
CSYGISCLVLLCFVHIPSDDRIDTKQTHLFAGFSDGLAFLKTHRGLLILVLMMACMNFLSRITYENTLSPMILARSGGNTAALGLVNAVLGAAGIAGGLLASSGLFSKEPVRMVFWSAGFSFQFGDILMGLGRNVFTWCLAGAFASLPIAFVMAGQNVILYRTIPEEMQGRVCAVRNAIQYGTIPAGILLGGALADYVFEPFMAGSSALAQMLQHLVGSGTGCGMAVMFLCTGTIGACFSFLAYRQKSIQAMRKRCYSPPVIK